MTPNKSWITPFMKQCFVTAAVGSNIIGHGCTIGFPAILLPQLQQPDSFIKLSSAEESWLAAVLGITQLVGSFITSPIMSRFGRRFAHFVVTIPVLVGWFTTILATNFEELLLGRILQGLSIGMLSPLRSVLIGEYASPRNRGAFLTTISLTQAFGIFFVHLIGSILSWQKTALICVFFSFVSLVMTIYSPESPSWLASKNRYEESREVFRWLRGNDEEDELEEMIQARMLYEDAAISLKAKRSESRFREMITTIKKKEFHKPIILMMHAYVMVQFAGGTTMAAYSTKIIKLILGPAANANFWMIVLDTQRLISNSVAVFVINKLKRRTMMFATGGLCVFSQIAISGYTYLRSEHALPYDAMWIPALLINLQFFTVATGMLPLPNVIGGEVFPLEYKSIGGTISLATMSVSFFLVLKTFPGLVDSVGVHGTYTVYSLMLCYCLLVIWILLPETKGKTLQQIEDEFRGRPLNRQELEEKEIFHSCPVLAYKRKMSMRRCSSHILH
ncbi:facilitated trehalose transporter Tret1-like isoform X3 [Bombyx mori]|uniref:Major facilitator superfamily (MFS) profile domain-containing protein n=1 Tax=Bombyx mori TaxID=7091 RepID=A0A8R2RC01_BOMMO|nr:facilitated trehalose transporter Tret1-like [Bombyx mori]XP_037877228.1 facilitated trehalose transporter Tret1-like [Bombyx mori]